MTLQPAPFDSKFDTCAIRLPQIERGVPKFGGTHPVVLFASQGQAPLDVPVGARRGNYGEGVIGGSGDSFTHVVGNQRQNGSPLPESYDISRVIFILDCSKSMNWSLHSEAALGKLNYVKSRIEGLANDYFPPSTKISLINFNREHRVESFDFLKNSPITQLKRAVSRLEAGPGTNFHPPLEAARQIILDDHLKVSNSQIEQRGVPRSVIVFLTDGQDRLRNGDDHPAATFTQLRDLNTTSFVLGIGQDYQMSRIVGLAGHAGSSSWSHLPMERGALDPFSVQLPLMLEQILRCDTFFEFQARGDFIRFSCVTPTIRFASCYSPEAVFPGYIRDAVGVLYEKRDNLELSLVAGRYCQDRDAERIDIPVIDIADAHHLFEKAREAGELDHAARALRAEDYSKRSVILTALMEQDQELLRAIAEIDPSLGDKIEKLKGTLSGYTRDPSRGAHKLFSDISEVGNTTQLDTSLMNREELQALQDTKLAESKTNKAAPAERKYPTQTPKNDPEYPPVKDVLNTYFKRQGPVEQNPPQEGEKTIEMEELFSGCLGPLDEKSGTIRVPELPSELDARIYDHVPARKLFDVELINSSGQLISLSHLNHENRYILGRSKSHQDGMPIVLNLETISRRHAMIFLKDNEVHIKDLGSRTGTLLGRQKVPTESSLKLCDGDTLTLSQVTLTVKIRKN